MVALSQWILNFNWLVIIGALMLVGWLATHVAHRVESKPLQYLALAGFVFAQAIIFAPLTIQRTVTSARRWRCSRRSC